MTGKTFAGIFTSKAQEDIIVSSGRKRRRSSFIVQESHHGIYKRKIKKGVNWIREKNRNQTASRLPLFWIGIAWEEFFSLGLLAFPSLSSLCFAFIVLLARLLKKKKKKMFCWLGARCGSQTTRVYKINILGVFFIFAEMGMFVFCFQCFIGSSLKKIKKKFCWLGARCGSQCTRVYKISILGVVFFFAEMGMFVFCFQCFVGSSLKKKKVLLARGSLWVSDH